MTRIATALCLVLAAAPSASARRRSFPQLRRGAALQDEWVIGHMRDTTVEYLLGKRQVRWRKSHPFHRRVETVEVLHHHKDWRTRAAAVDDLLFTPSAEVEEALIRALRDPVPAVRERATRALGEIGTNRSLLPLMHAMKNTPGPVRDSIGETLRRLTGEDYGRHYDRWIRWWQANRDALQ